MKVIYILEDNPEQLKALTAICRRLGYKVFAYTTSNDLEGNIDVSHDILCFMLDLSLKETKNGFQVAEKIVREKNIPVTKFLFITGWKPQFEAIKPDIFSNNIIINKANWTKEELIHALKSIDTEINSQENA